MRILTEHLDKKRFLIIAIATFGIGAIVLLWLQLSLRLIITLIFGGIFALLVFFYPFWGLCAFISLIPLEEAFLITEKLTLLKIIGLWVFFVWLVHTLYRRDKMVIPQTFSIAFLLFGVWGLASVLWAQDVSAAIVCWVTMLLLVGFLFIVFQMANSWRKFHLLVLSYVVGTIVAGALGLYNFLTIGLSPQWRISALINLQTGQYVQNPGHYGILLALGIFYFLVMFLFRRGFWLRAFYFASFSALLVAALASGTRSFIVSFAVALLALIWYLWRVGAWKKSIALWVSAIAVVAIITAIMPPYFFERAESIWTTLGDRGAGRLDIWKVFLVEIAENPLLGVGLANGPLRYDEYRTIAVDRYGISLVHPGAWSSGRDIHSIYLQSWVELGTIGFVLFILLIITLARQMYKALRIAPLYSREWQLGLVVALNFVALLVTGFSEPSLIRKYLWLGFALIPAYARLMESDPERFNKLQRKGWED